jgi:hypothetical protein
MKWLFLLTAGASLLLGACAGHSASCSVSNVCAGTQIANAPTYLAGSCGRADYQAVMKAQTTLINDTTGSLTGVRYSQRVLLYDDHNPQQIWADSQERGNVFTCDADSGCAATRHLVTITSTTTQCPCDSDASYQTYYVVGTQWDPVNLGYVYSYKGSVFSRAPGPR